MLILSRKAGEAVDLHDTRTNQPVATVVVLGIAANGTVRLGFEAEAHVRILRDNVIPKKERDNGIQEDNREEDEDTRGNR